MLACVDSQYGQDVIRTAAVLFSQWNDASATQELLHEEPSAAEAYVPGEFYKRELPLILATLQPVLGELQSVVIDGYVWLDSNGRKGLGAWLHESLAAKVVIGVAKTHFQGSAAIELLRGKSQSPLFVTAAGIDVSEAARCIESMHGEYRIPTLLKRADFLARHGLAT